MEGKLRPDEVTADGAAEVEGCGCFVRTVRWRFRGSCGSASETEASEPLEVEPSAVVSPCIGSLVSRIALIVRRDVGLIGEAGAFGHVKSLSDTWAIEPPVKFLPP